jgi:capsular polysaccharide export protein
MKELRVGGDYWASQPRLPQSYVLVRSAAALPAAKNLAAGRPIVLWDRFLSGVSAEGALIASGQCDPWHMLDGASILLAEPGDELCLVAALLDVEYFAFHGPNPRQVRLNANELISENFGGTAFENPFTGEPMSVLDAVELCGFWRHLIDSNRDIACGMGFAFWKQAYVAPLLWHGTGPFQFAKNGAEASSKSAIAVWRSKVARRTIHDLERAGVPLIEVEDGFLRSRGLGADCVPPLSITVDRNAPHFDPSRPSDLENLIETAEFDDLTIERARELRRLIMAHGIGKYEQGKVLVDRPAGQRRHILVPGQVEDDRSVQTGGCGLTSNLELLKRVRDQAPDAYILYKPHPDVLAGHRRGAIPQRLCLEYADEIVGAVPVDSLIAMVDEVHVNTSLAGFEALLRAKPVTTYGVPFYAGWGLTRDLGQVPARRTRTRTIDELVAAALLLYPRYLDPVTGLPCPAEIAVDRLIAEARDPGLVVVMRRLQGRFMRRLRSLVQ